MNAQFLMMNHFSQRYPKVPVFRGEFVEKSGIAFDLMTVKFSDFPIIPKLLPVLQEFFEDQSEEEEEPETDEQGLAKPKDAKAAIAANKIKQRELAWQQKGKVNQKQQQQQEQSQQHLKQQLPSKRKKVDDHHEPPAQPPNQ